MDIYAVIAGELGVRRTQVEAAAALLDEGNTVPFIARYRKEATGSLDDQVLRSLSDRLAYLRGFEARRQEIYRKIDEQGHMTDAVAAMLSGAKTMAELEDAPPSLPSPAQNARVRSAGTGAGAACRTAARAGAVLSAAACAGAGVCGPGKGRGQRRSSPAGGRRYRRRARVRRAEAQRPAAHARRRGGLAGDARGQKRGFRLQYIL